MGEDDNQALAAHTNKKNFNEEDNSHKKPNKYHKSLSSYKYYSKVRYYSCWKMGCIARNCPHTKDQSKKGKNKRYHAHTIEDDEPV